MSQNNYLGLFGYIKAHEMIKGTVDDNWGPSNTFEFTYTNNGAIISGNEATFPAGSSIDFNEYFIPGSRAWQVTYRVKTGDISGSQVIIGSEKNYTNFTSCIWDNGKCRLWVDTTGEINWDVDQMPSNYTEPGTLYDVKISWDKQFYRSTWTKVDTGTIIDDYSKENINPMYTTGSHLRLGSNHQKEFTFKGTLYLDTIKFKIFD